MDNVVLRKSMILSSNLFIDLGWVYYASVINYGLGNQSYLSTDIVGLLFINDMVLIGT